MSKLKLPVICPNGFSGVMTQGYFQGSHDAIDFVVWSPKLSYKDNQRASHGSQLVCPLKEAVVVVEEYRPDGMWEFKDGKKVKGVPGGWIDIEGMYEGRKLRLHFQHNTRNLFKLGDKVKEGDVVALMGNYGPCVPMPTTEAPFNGTHCHLSIYENGKVINPLDIIDITQWYHGEDYGASADVDPLNWAFEKLNITTPFEKLMYILKYLWR
jgi:hypothetical protein